MKNNLKHPSAQCLLPKTRNAKSGISLIAVLMFMLAATTASIVLFRWLGSENLASGSRLKQAEALQASESGLDAVQAWLTNKGADAGALLSQYVYNPNGSEKTVANRLPIQLNQNTLGEISGSRKQKFDVYLTGADIANGNYKLKFLSIGTARDGSKATQSAIFDINGLYKVQISTPGNSNDIDFDYALYYTGGLGNSQNNNVSSLVLNGGTGNDGGSFGTVSGNLLATGDVILKGSDAHVGGIACIGGNLASRNVGLTTNNDVYVGGNLGYSSNDYASINTKGNLYVGGGMYTKDGAPAISIGKNMTIFGTLTNAGIFSNFTVGGNLVVGPSGYLNFTSPNNNYTLRVADSVWIPNNLGLQGNTATKNRILGEKTTALAAINNSSCNATSCAHNETNVPFTTNGDFISTFSDTDNRKPSGAEIAKTQCEELWGETTTCSDGSFVMNDPIITAYNEYAKYANKPNCAKDITTLEQNSTKTDELVTKLNQCYQSAASNDLYNNEFLVVKLSVGQNSNGWAGSEALSGKFIIIIDGGTMNNGFQLAPTTKSGMVMLYFTDKPTFNSVELKPVTCSANVSYNYFIYSLQNFGSISGFKDNCPLDGTIYHPSLKEDGTCNSYATQTQINATLTSNPDLIKALAIAGVICDSKATNCGSSSGSDGSSVTEGNSGGISINDPHYIPVSSRLSVALETKSITTERESEQSAYIKINPSILVMPRIVYIATNEFESGLTLRNYYTYMLLNGATPADTSTIAPNCGTLSQNGTNVEGLYTCEWPNNPTVPHSPFYVKVAGTNTNPKIYLSPYGQQTVTNAEIETGNGTHCKTFSIMSDAISHDGEQWTADITQDAPATGWTISTTTGGGCTKQGELIWNCVIQSGQLGSAALEICTSAGNISQIGFTLSNLGGGVIPDQAESGAKQHVSFSREAPIITVTREELPSESLPDGYVACPPTLAGNWADIDNCINKSGVDPSWMCEWNAASNSATVNPRIIVPVGCEIAEGSREDNTTLSLTLTPNGTTDNKFFASLKWKKYEVTAICELIIITVEGNDVPAPTCNNGKYELYHNKEYQITLKEGIPAKELTCSENLVCVTPTATDGKHYLTPTTTGTIKATGPGILELRDPTPPTLSDCSLKKSTANVGEEITVNGWIEKASLSGYGCEGGIITYTINGEFLPYTANIETELTVNAIVVGGDGCSSVGSKECGTITVTEQQLPACDFQQSWCPNIDWNTGIKWGETVSDPDWNNSYCFFIAGTNNTTPTANCHSGDECKVTAGDGGFYFYTEGGCVVNGTRYKGTDCDSRSNGYTGVSNQSNEAPTKPTTCTGPILPPPTLSCENIGAKTTGAGTSLNNAQINNLPTCSYGTLSGVTWYQNNGTTPIDFDTQGGPYNNPVVKATCNSTQLEATCTGSIEVSAGGGTILVNLVYNGDNYNFEPGNIYEVQCTGQQKTFVCDGGNGTLYVNGGVRSPLPCNNGGNCGTCLSSMTVTVTGGVSCGNKW